MDALPKHSCIRSIFHVITVKFQDPAQRSQRCMFGETLCSFQMLHYRIQLTWVSVLTEDRIFVKIKIVSKHLLTKTRISPWPLASPKNQQPILNRSRQSSIRPRNIQGVPLDFSLHVASRFVRDSANCTSLN